MISSYEITNQLAFDAHFTIRPLKIANRRPKWPHAVTARSKAGVIPVLINGQEAE
ncbi:hypothetical protein GO287_02044 [Ralstonia solanacearum]|uniref:hypothetical protein n=1 Tax=Ralstonia pseudosolanacearum TaxID=1310165 RepID=UPI001402FE08|nr:hypothetical protein [Ralstonia pseudosolanacearum]KAF3461267.1 hypothetical protein GO278_000768 [Ralstonia solanacearum]NKA77629.1 hypothetical protein [Ralstonia solanacearum]NKG00119.1 hypothetical protein [Ralstonia solanacearum]NKG04834.1 hypothetical protein [Ralstonia solanacearum]UNJ30238.1 hypothetical protein MNY32_02665 [Ralstonia pseudosolanacearum]